MVNPEAKSFPNESGALLAIYNPRHNMIIKRPTTNNAPIKPVSSDHCKDRIGWSNRETGEFGGCPANTYTEKTAFYNCFQ